MALDWNKQISFGKSAKHTKKAGNTNYPTKTSMNLYVTESTLKLNRVIPVAVVLLVLVGLFIKFGVVDQYARLQTKEAELSRQQLELTQMENQLVNYDAVLATYQSYSSTGDPDAVDAISVLNLVTAQIMPYANVTNISLNSDVLSLTISGTSLSTVGDLASKLNGQDMVESVSVSTAANNANAGTGDVATLTVKLKNGNASTNSSSSNSSGSKSSSSSSSAKK